MEQSPNDHNLEQTELFAVGHDMSQPVTNETIEQAEARKEIARNAWSLAQSITEDVRENPSGPVKLVDGFNGVYAGKRHDVTVFARGSQEQPERMSEWVDKTSILMHLKEGGQELYVQQAAVADGSSELEAFTVQTPEAGFGSSVKSKLFGSAVLYALNATFRGDRTGMSEERFDIMKDAGYLQIASSDDVASFANKLGYSGDQTE
ncbi:MAG: hypothetical protein ABIR91_00375 [Candidatus Saccharimonadales bacterium]